MRTGRRRIAAGLAALALATVALPAGPAPGGEAGRLPPARPGRVVDATGRLVGRVVAVLDIAEVSVWLQASGRDVFLQASPDEIQLVPLAQAVYESDNCGGPPFLLVGTFPAAGVFFSPPLALGPGREALAPDGPAVMKTVQSVFSTATDPPCTAIAPTNVSVQPGLKILDLDDWQPPFSRR